MAIGARHNKKKGKGASSPGKKETQKVKAAQPKK
jgi:hypothetical protein